MCQVRLPRTHLVDIADGTDRLAGLPKDVLDVAQTKADQLKVETGRRLLASFTRRTRRLLLDTKSSPSTPHETLRNADVLYKTLGMLGRP